MIVTFKVDLKSVLRSHGYTFVVGVFVAAGHVFRSCCIVFITFVGFIELLLF